MQATPVLCQRMQPCRWCCCQSVYACSCLPCRVTHAAKCICLSGVVVVAVQRQGGCWLARHTTLSSQRFLLIINSFCALPSPSSASYREKVESNPRAALRQEADAILKRKDEDSGFRVYVLDPDEVGGPRACGVVVVVVGVCLCVRVRVRVRVRVCVRVCVCAWGWGGGMF